MVDTTCHFNDRHPSGASDSVCIDLFSQVSEE